MNVLIKMLKPLILRILKKELAKQETRSMVLVFLNNKLDLPKLDEQEEARLFGQIYDAIRESLELVLGRI